MKQVVGETSVSTQGVSNTFLWCTAVFVMTFATSCGKGERDESSSSREENTTSSQSSFTDKPKTPAVSAEESAWESLTQLPFAEPLRRPQDLAYDESANDNGQLEQPMLDDRVANAYGAFSDFLKTNEGNDVDARVMQAVTEISQELNDWLRKHGIAVKSYEEIIDGLASRKVLEKVFAKKRRFDTDAGGYGVYEAVAGLPATETCVVIIPEAKFDSDPMNPFVTLQVRYLGEQPYILSDGLREITEYRRTYRYDPTKPISDSELSRRISANDVAVHDERKARMKLLTSIRAWRESIEGKDSIRLLPRLPEPFWYTAKADEAIDALVAAGAEYRASGNTSDFETAIQAAIATLKDATEQLNRLSSQDKEHVRRESRRLKRQTYDKFVGGVHGVYAMIASEKVIKERLEGFVEAYGKFEKRASR